MSRSGNVWARKRRTKREAGALRATTRNVKLTNRTTKVMTINAKTKLATAKKNGATVAKVAKVSSAITGNFWKKMKELGSYAYGVKLYCLRGADYTGQALCDWTSAKGAERKLVLMIAGKRGNAALLVSAKGSIVRVSADKGFDTAQLKSATLVSKNQAIALVKSKGKATKGFIYDGRTFNGHLMDSGEHYSVFTDGKELFEGEAQRIAGKSEAQAKHVWQLGGK